MEARARFIAVSRIVFRIVGAFAVVLAAAMATVVVLMVAGSLPGTAAAGMVEYASFCLLLPTGMIGWLLLFYSRRLR